MKHIIFYSWQSDLDPSLTRNFIEDAIKASIKKISAIDNIEVDAVIDRDTAGLSGAPGIAETIYEKIEQCDIFIADISPINNNISNNNIKLLLKIILDIITRKSKKTRPTPNPNVLIELGYAAAKLGWDRIIPIVNLAYGKIDDLPFDIRSRRIVRYYLQHKNFRHEEREKFNTNLTNAIKNNLEALLMPINIPTIKTPRWFGYWRTTHTTIKGNNLLIYEVGDNNFRFYLTLFDGSRTGEISGIAKYTGPDSAYAKISQNGGLCEIKFRRINNNNQREIIIEESIGCNHFKGMGTSFNGIYICENNNLFDFGFLDELDLQRLYTITGTLYYQELINRFSQIGQSECLDPTPSQVITGGAKGLYQSYAAIIIKGINGELWAAYIDSGNSLMDNFIDKMNRFDNNKTIQPFPARTKSIVRYFTTEAKYKNKIPLTIAKWHEPFNDKEITYEHTVKIIPGTFE